MRLFDNRLLLIPAFSLCCAPVLAAAPTGFGTWTDTGTGITVDCSAGFTCTSGTTEGTSGEGFLQRQITDTGGSGYIQTIVTGDPGEVSDSTLLGFRIEGVITDAESDDPLPGIWVSVYNSDGVPLNYSSGTDSAGHYVTGPLAAGDYFVKAEPGPNYQGELYDNQRCVAGSCDVTTGTAVTVTADSAPAPVNFTLDKGARITGTIRDADSNEPLENISVVVMTEAGFIASSGSTDSSGHYWTNYALPAGRYYLHTVNKNAYIDERYNGQICITPCDVLDDTPLDITGNGPVSGIDFALVKGGRISGHVTDTGNSAPIQDITVSVYDADGTRVTDITTDSNGEYMTGAGLPAGQYYLRTANSQAYLNGIYSGQPCTAYYCDATTGNPVGVVKAETAADIDFTLERGGSISGTVTDAVTGQGLTSAAVYIYNTGGELVDLTSVKDGFYTSGSGLPTGSYFAHTGNYLGYINERYDELPLAGSGGVTAATPIPVTAGQSTLGIDFTVDKGSLISGTIGGLPTDPSALTSPPRVLIFDADGDPVSIAYPGRNGFYISGAAVPPGDYYVEVEDSTGMLGNMLYDGTGFTGSCNDWQRCDVTMGTPVTVNESGNTENINFTTLSVSETGGKADISKNTTGGPAAISIQQLVLLTLAYLFLNYRRKSQPAGIDA